MSLNQGTIAVQWRPHLTKEQRLPKYLKEVEKIIKSVKSCRQNYKTVLANSRLRGRVFKKVYSLTVNVLKNFNYIEKIIEKVQLLEKEKFLRKEIASVLIYELLFGNESLPGDSKVVTILKSYENDIRSAHEILQNNWEDSATFGISIPRYARVHTLVTTVPYVIKDLESYGFKQIFYDENLPEDKYLELVQNLEKRTFLVDFHFKDILVFESQENLVSLELYNNGHIFLQDKASYIPVHVLNPEPNSAVLDACAAPGMKTLHIASKMKNKGILIACERDKPRFESLKKMLECGSVKTCKMLCKDFKSIDPKDQAYSVDYILLDPSCSGSGMVNRMDKVTDTEDSKNKERLTKLAGFQIILLKHALRFPSVKRVVYSTCSVHEEENEYVVQEALASCDGRFKLAPAMPEWSCRGSENYVFGELCLRTVPEKHLTNGFFVAVFERVDDKNAYSGRQYSRKRKSEINGLDSFPEEMNSGFEKQDSSEIANENHHKSKYSKKRECAYNLQQSKYFHKNKEVESCENCNQSVTDETVNELLNADHMKQKSKKHSKNKEKNLNEFSQSCNGIKLKESIDTYSEQPLGCFEQENCEDILHSESNGIDVSVKSKKHKRKKIDTTSGNVKITRKQSDIASPVEKLQTKHNTYHENTEIYPTTTLNTLNEDTEMNYSQNMIDCEILGHQQKKKHKKNKSGDKSSKCLIESDNITKSESSSGMLSESLQKCLRPKDSESISLAEIDSTSKEKLNPFSCENVQIGVDLSSRKKKKKRKHSLSIEMNSNISVTTSGATKDGTETCNEKSHNCTTNTQEKESFDHTRKKKHKESKSNVLSETPQQYLKHEEGISPSIKAKDENEFSMKENSPLHKKKKAKRASVEEICSLETQTAQCSNDLDSSAQYGKDDLEVVYIGSTENVPVKKKKHKKSKNVNLNDVYKDSSVSVNDSTLFSQLSEKSTENSNDVLQMQDHAKVSLENEEASCKHGKKKKSKRSDKDSDDMANAPALNSAIDIMVVYDNKSSLTPNDSVTVHKSKKHKH